MLADSAKIILLTNGWSSNHSTNPKRFELSLRSKGFEPHRAALDFLERFGGLLVEFLPPGDPNKNSFDFNVEDGGFFDIDDIVDYGNSLATKLCPIGQARRGHLSLVMAEDGRVFGYFNPYIVFLGHDGEDAINNICSNTQALKRAVYDGKAI